MNQKHSHSDSHEHGKKHGAKIHHDWRFWAVILMLVAIGIYVLTLDESIAPGGDGQKVPAAAAP